MKTLTRKQVVSAISAATQDVFSVLGLPVEAQEARREEHDATASGGIVALMGLSGTWTASGRFYCSPDFACSLATALLCTKYFAVNEEVLDAVAEVANMIAGNIQARLEEDLGPLALSVPTVIFGRNWQARSSGMHDWTVLPFQSASGSMEMHFCLRPSRPSQQSHGSYPRLDRHLEVVPA